MTTAFYPEYTAVDAMFRHESATMPTMFYHEATINSACDIPTLCIGSVLSYLPDKELIHINSECKAFAHDRAARTLQRAYRVWVRQSAVVNRRTYIKCYIGLNRRDNAAEILANNLAMRRYDTAVSYYNASAVVYANMQLGIQNVNSTFSTNNTALMIYREFETTFDQLIERFIETMEDNDNASIFFNSMWHSVYCCADRTLNHVWSSELITMVAKLVMDRFQEHLLDCIYDIPFGMPLNKLVDIADDRDIDEVIESLA